MTVLTLYCRPRNMVRRLLKPLLLWLNAWRMKCSESEVYRLRATWETLQRAEGSEYRHQIKLLRQRDAIRGWQ